MALRGLSHRIETSMDYILNRAAEPGTMVVASGTAGLVDVAGIVPLASGTWPIGMLLNTREDFNYAKELERTQYDTDDIGTVVTLLRSGFVNTNLVVANGGAIAPGQPAYLAPNGFIGNANLSPSGVADESRKVGQFMSAVDADGYARVSLKMQ